MNNLKIILIRCTPIEGIDIFDILLYKEFLIFISNMRINSYYYLNLKADRLNHNLMNFSPYKYDEYIIESFENKPLKKSSTVKKMKWRNFVHP
jgi:hypothetical protein